MNNAERRRFHRAPFDAEVSLSVGGTTQQSIILDCSINGAQVKRLPDLDLPMGTEVGLVWNLDLELKDAIRMQTEVAWISDTSLGLRCLYIDIDSISHLRRMLELNLGDAGLLERDIEHLAG